MEKNCRRMQVLILSVLLMLFCLASTASARQGLVQELTSDKLFFDDFDEGIKANWNAVEGKWRMVNGTLRPVEGATAKIRLDGFELSEGVIEFTVGNLARYNDFRIGIKRQKNSEAGYWFLFNRDYVTCYLEKIDGKLLEFFDARHDVYTNYNYSVRIEMNNNLSKLIIDGKMVCSYSDDTFGSGFISFYMTPRNDSNPYPWIDDFNVYEK